MNRKLLDSLVRFGLVGGLTTGVVYLAFIGMLKSGIHYLVAAALGWAIGLGISYVLNRNFTFKVTHKAKPREYGAFNTGCWSLNMNVVPPNAIAPGNFGSSTITLAFALNSLSM